MPGVAAKAARAAARATADKADKAAAYAKAKEVTAGRQAKKLTAQAKGTSSFIADQADKNAADAKAIARAQAEADAARRQAKESSAAPPEAAIGEGAIELNRAGAQTKVLGDCIQRWGDLETWVLTGDTFLPIHLVDLIFDQFHHLDLPAVKCARQVCRNWCAKAQFWYNCGYRSATAFSGSVTGYCFKLGYRGLGYYRDYGVRFEIARQARIDFGKVVESCGFVF